MVETARPQITI